MPAEIRRPFVIAGVSVSVAWAVTGLFLSLIPSFVTITLKGNPALAGAVVALMLATATVAQLSGYRFDSHRAQTIGLMIMIFGVVALILPDNTQTLGWLLVATVLGGAGMGLAFMGSLGDVNETAPEDRKGDIVASYYVVVYIATAIPAVGVGALTIATGSSSAIQIFGYAVIALCLGGLAGLFVELQARRHSEPGRPLADPSSS